MAVCANYHTSTAIGLHNGRNFLQTSSAYTHVYASERVDSMFINKMEIFRLQEHPKRPTGCDFN